VAILAAFVLAAASEPYEYDLKLSPAVDLSWSLDYEQNVLRVKVDYRPEDVGGGRGGITSITWRCWSSFNACFSHHRLDRSGIF